MSFCGEIFEHSRGCSTYLPLFKVTPTRDSLVSGVSLGVRDIVQLNIIDIHVRVELKSSNISTCFETGIQLLLKEYLRFEASGLYVRILYMAVNFLMLRKLFNSLHKGRISRPYILSIHLRAPRQFQVPVDYYNGPTHHSKRRQSYLLCERIKERCFLG